MAITIQELESEAKRRNVPVYVILDEIILNQITNEPFTKEF